MNEDVVNNVPQLIFCQKPIANNHKKSKSIQAKLLVRLCIIYWFYFITFSQLFSVDGLFWTYWRLTLSFFLFFFLKRAKCL